MSGQCGSSHASIIRFSSVASKLANSFNCFAAKCESYQKSIPALALNGQGRPHTGTNRRLVRVLQIRGTIFLKSFVRAYARREVLNEEAYYFSWSVKKVALRIIRGLVKTLHSNRVYSR